MTKRILLIVFFLLTIVFGAFANKGVLVSEESFVPYPKKFENLSNEDRILSLLNVLTSISTQEGLTYFSKLEGKETVLFEESYLIDDCSNPESKICDPVFSHIPNSLTLYSVQKDNRFGFNVYQLDYSVYTDNVELTITNKTKMKYMGLTLISPEKLEMKINVSLIEDGFSFESSARTDSVKLFVEDSFARRINALCVWFKNRISEVE